MESIKNSKDAFIIAEIGVNYYDIAKKESITVLEAAKLMIKEAKNAGAQAAKFQTYKAGKIASKKHLLIGILLKKTQNPNMNYLLSSINLVKVNMLN